MFCLQQALLHPAHPLKKPHCWMYKEHTLPCVSTALVTSRVVPGPEWSQALPQPRLGVNRESIMLPGGDYRAGGPGFSSPLASAGWGVRRGHPACLVSERMRYFPPRAGVAPWSSCASWKSCWTRSGAWPPDASSCPGKVSEQALHGMASRCPWFFIQSWSAGDLLGTWACHWAHL